MAHVDDWTADEVAARVRAGGRFVTFTTVYSVVIASFRVSTRAVHVPPGGIGFWPAVVPTLVTLLFGPWGLPWGPLFVLDALYVNFGGGRDVTDEVVARSRDGSAEPRSFGPQ